MIQKFLIKNFKSLFLDESIILTERLNVFIGLNGVGKSTLLQAIDFVVNLVVDYDKWLDKRQWQSSDLISKLKKQGEKGMSPLIEFEILFNPCKVNYCGSFNIQKERCSKEEISAEIDGKKYSSFVSNQYLVVPFIEKFKLGLEMLQYKGSAFSAILPSPLAGEVRNVFSSCRSLELLNPKQMRSRVRLMTSNGVGVGGEQLSLFLYSLPKEDQEEIVRVMKRFYPSFQIFKTVKLRGGAKRLEINERFLDGTTLTSEAIHVCDGVLRVLSIIAETFAYKGGTILIDEIDDGINPELLEKLIDYLKTEAPCQVIITTHNPFILSCLSDKEAIDSVFLTYKKSNGRSSVAPFFSLPEPKKLLESLYPGEVMLQVNLEEVSQSIKELT